MRELYAFPDFVILSRSSIIITREYYKIIMTLLYEIDTLKISEIYSFICISVVDRNIMRIDTKCHNKFIYEKYNKVINLKK